MGLLNYLTFDGVKTSDYGVFISGEGTFNAPERRGELINIPGRNGALFIDEGSFENIEVTYPAFIGSNVDNVFRNRLAALRNEYKTRVSYVRLEDTYHPDEFRLAFYQSGLEVEPWALNRSGQFELIFNCKPQRFLKSGETVETYTANGYITNPTLFDALPLIKVEGDGQVAIGSYTFTVSDNPGVIYIDTEIMECYVPAGEVTNWTDEELQDMTDEYGIILQLANGPEEVISMNSFVSFTNSLMPKIEPGEQNVGLQNTITSVEITPRWWQI